MLQEMRRESTGQAGDTTYFNRLPTHEELLARVEKLNTDLRSKKSAKTAIEAPDLVGEGEDEGGASFIYLSGIPRPLGPNTWWGGWLEVP